jgi:hypothetical protein
MIKKYIKYYIFCWLNILLLTSCGVYPYLNKNNNNSFYTHKSQKLRTNAIVFYDSTVFLCGGCGAIPINFAKSYILTPSDLREIDFLLYALFYTNKYQITLLPINHNRLLLQYHAYYNNEQQIVINIALLDKRYYHNKRDLLYRHQYYDKTFQLEGYLPKHRTYYIMWNLNITVKEILYSQIKLDNVKLLVIYK